MPVPYSKSLVINQSVASSLGYDKSEGDEVITMIVENGRLF